MEAFTRVASGATIMAVITPAHVAFENNLYNAAKQTANFNGDAKYSPSCQQNQKNNINVHSYMINNITSWLVFS